MRKLRKLYRQKINGFTGMLLELHTLSEERFHDHELTDRIILNMVGECADA
ncbi:hypothetical protein [Xenorhabdus bovienii]|uniref:Uncharacterized protein n=1 Tax=Xenorhabdus bovienii str. feltiae Moldova TaxID=1398200 RepID=A0A077NM15_XENBV|nr:hypothetical protein [Xenorhabdus bovienii]CDG99604.1 hypothetical protein XBFM1_1090013 [Xenorhabdus bovienii str. feltiae Moldova]